MLGILGVELGGEGDDDEEGDEEPAIVQTDLNAEDRTKAIVHAVNRISYPARCVRMSLVTRCNQIIERCLNLLRG